jgi:hypothetical protein
LAFGLRCKLETTLAVIVACAVLHNFCIIQQEIEPEMDPEAEQAINEVNEAAKEHELGIRAETNNPHRQAASKRARFATDIAAISDFE